MSQPRSLNDNGSYFNSKIRLIDCQMILRAELNELRGGRHHPAEGKEVWDPQSKVLGSKMATRVKRTAWSRSGPAGAHVHVLSHPLWTNTEWEVLSPVPVTSTLHFLAIIEARFMPGTNQPWCFKEELVK